MNIRIFYWILLSMFASATQAQTVSREAMERAKTTGDARVMVVFRDVADPAFAKLKTDTRRARVRMQGDALLRRLPANGRVRDVRRYAAVPAISLVADATVLNALVRDPNILRVDLDEGGTGHAAAPDTSSVLNQVHQLSAMGLSGSGMKVAVVDSGVDSDHADLLTRIVDQRCFCSAGTGCCPNGTASQSGAGAAEDDHGHGTNVAGIIAGDGTVAPRGALTNVALVAVKVLDRNNSFCCSSDIVSALDWIATNHPDVDAVNLSLGTGTLFAGHCNNASAANLALASAVANLNALGAVVVASTGNQGSLTQTSSPACIANVMGIAATWDVDGGPITFLGCSETSTASKQPTCFSNRSTTTDLFGAGAFVSAPGFNGGTSIFGGTSQAAPMVAACAIALKQTAPASTVAQRMDAMTLSMSRIDDVASGRTYPFLDCRDALKLLNPGLFAPRVLNGSMPRRRPRTTTATTPPASQSTGRSQRETTRDAAAPDIMRSR